MNRLRDLHPGQAFTAVPNAAMDRLPDLESLGLLNHVLRHTDEWKFRLEDLLKKPGVTRRTASRARATLIRYGHLVAVKFRHNYRGLFATEVWRSGVPFTDDDLVEIARRYQHGAVAQIAKLGKDKKPLVDNVGRVLLREVEITWARLEGFRGEQLVHADGTLTLPPEQPDEDESSPS